MKKRAISLLLCIILVLTAVPVGVAAEGDQQLRNLVSSTYRRALNAAGMESFAGYCGMMAGYQLWALGVTYSPEIYDGKNMFDAYAAVEQTSGGYPVKAYPATDYSLEEALYSATCMGTRDIYNALVGFQYTTTSAGAQYGHALVLHAIVDGTVYFVESFYLNGPEGTVLAMSIADFCKAYDDWTVFEGLIVFGDGADSDWCKSYPTDIHVRVAEAGVIKSQPYNQSDIVRKVYAGEVFRAVAVYETEDGSLYYRLRDGGFIACEAVTVLQTDSAAVSLRELQVSADETGEKTVAVFGSISTENPVLKGLRLTVTDAQGNQVVAKNSAAQGCIANLEVLTFEKPLAVGDGTIRIYADMELCYVVGGKLVLENRSVLVYSAGYRCQDTVQVGGFVAESLVRNGWIAENNTLYYYQNGNPRVGWFCDNGTNYYFREDGSITTGWIEINGRYRYFTETGVLWTGWLETEQGIYYMLSNGVPALGQRQIDGVIYDFGEDGLLCRETVE